MKDRAIYFPPETIVASFLQRMVLLFKELYDQRLEIFCCRIASQSYACVTSVVRTTRRLKTTTTTTKKNIFF